MRVPVAVWQPCELLYTCYLLTDVVPMMESPPSFLQVGRARLLVCYSRRVVVNSMLVRCIVGSSEQPWRPRDHTRRPHTRPPHRSFSYRINITRRAPTWSSTEQQLARPATKRFHPSSDWRAVEACCRPWTWWCNDATALAGYATMTMMMMMVMAINITRRTLAGRLI